MAAKSVTDLIGAARVMPGADSAELYSDTAAQVCQRSLDNLFKGKLFSTLHIKKIQINFVLLNLQKKNWQ